MGSSAEEVNGNGDLLTEILRRLGAKPLCRLKLVSTRWLSLISDGRFSLVHASSNKPNPSALLLCSSGQHQRQALVPFDNFVLGPHHFQFLSQPGITILHSCHGFFCYSKLGQRNDRPILEYYACNATTRKSVKIPLMALVIFSRRDRGRYKLALHKLCRVNIEDFIPENEPTIHVLGVYVAFAPQNSPNYRVVCVWEGDSFIFNYKIEIAVYRSETGSWGEVLGPFEVPYEVSFAIGVFWNDSFHWIGNNYLVYFNIDRGEHNVISLPLASKEAKPIYFGDSRGHLHVVINADTSNNILLVYEMERDYSMWELKFCVDMEPVVVLVPEIELKQRFHCFSFVYLDRGEKKDELSLVLGIDGKLICYSLESKTLKKLCDLHPFHFHNKLGWAPFDCFKSFPFHETILGV